MVQRYGAEVPGGAELACRAFATRLAARGHRVDVLTSRALSYVDWADHYPAGSEVLDGVTVHRLSVVRPRNDSAFERLNTRTVWGHRPVPFHLQEQWIRDAGPLLDGYVPWLEARMAGYDVVVFFSYLYYPTWAGLPVASGRVATVLHPCAHDEPPLYLPLFQTMFRHAGALAFFTEEEQALVGRAFPDVRRPAAVVGIGSDLDEGIVGDADGSAFRDAFGLGERPFLLYLGRLDPAKGADELFEFFTAYKARHPGPLALAMVGDPARPLPAHPDVVVTGVVDEETKHAALRACLALVQPSFFESFSLVLTEAWVHRKPALVQGLCDVLAGHVRRGGGGIPYRGFGEFEAGLELLLADAGLARRLGEAGRVYVERHYSWDKVLARYERLLGAVPARTV